MLQEVRSADDVQYEFAVYRDIHCLFNWSYDDYDATVGATLCYYTQVEGDDLWRN